MEEGRPDVPATSSTCGTNCVAAGSDVEANPIWSRQKSHFTTGSEDVFWAAGSKELGSDDDLGSLESVLTFKDVAFSVPGRRGEKDKTILEPVSGHLETGTLAAVMGPSGSGKTTLMDILANKKTAPYSGSVHFNGRKRDKLFARMTAYVPQNDVMPAYLTVKEVVLFHCALKCQWPAGFTADEAGKLIDKRLKFLDLYEVRDSRIGDEHIRGISGGQRRRVSLARGIVSGARLLFCDEPTSGLSATDAEKCVRYMRSIASRLRTTIVVVIHQPRVEVAELFDHLLLLTALPGRAVYNGPMAGAVSHFEKVVGQPMPVRMNPMDYCMDLVTPEARNACEDLCVEYYQAHCSPNIDQMVDQHLQLQRATTMELLEATRQSMSRYGDVPPVRNSKHAVRFRRQLRVVFGRQVTMALRDRQGVLTDWAVAVAKAFLVGVAYLRIGSLDATQQCGFFFMLLMSLCIEGMKNMPKVINERTIMKMEVSEALYSEWAYIVSFSVIQWVQQLISNTLYVVILFALSGLDWSLLGPVFLWTSLLSITFDSMYLMVASIAKDTATAFVLSLPFLMVFLLYNGFTATRETVPGFMVWALEVSPVAYAMESVVIAASKVYDDGLYPMLISHFGYIDEPERGIEVMVTGFLLFRTVQIVCMRVLNNVQR